MKWRWLIPAAWLTVLGLAACGDDRGRPTGLGPLPRPDAGGFDAGVLDGAPPPDAAGFCGNEFHSTGYSAPNLYFVFDRSGSMSTTASSDGDSRYALVRGAALDLLRTLGPLINVGAAVLPKGNIDANPCSTGGEVLAVRAGDAVTGQDGPTTQAFAWATKLEPFGGTPVAATLRAIYEDLRKPRGNTIVLLSTDGAPNCNEDTSCDVDQCIPHIEGLCSDDEDCCAPGGPGGPANCIDRQATLEAIAALATIGIEVYVIGIPGSAVFGDVLDAMAVAGRTAREGTPRYYRVDDLGEFDAVVASIAAGAIRCEFSLTDPPTGRDMTNVYLDGELIAYDETDGWTWESDDTSTVVLHGEACERLKTGGATTVQVVTGCPTETPR